MSEIVPANETGLTFADYLNILNKQWGVNVEALAGKMYRLAMGDDDTGDRRAIEYIFNRLLGKPIEQINLNANIVTPQIVDDIIKRISAGELIELRDATPLLVEEDDQDS